MKIHLVDGTYELFRSYFGAPPSKTPDGREVGATLGVMRSAVALIREERATHVAYAFDTVIESFRNQLFPGYKTGEGVPPDLMAQFPMVERAIAALGITVWSMIEFEADDALAAAAHRFADDPAVEQVVICTPDKDLAQCVRGERVVRLDRRKRETLGEDGIRSRYGIAPSAIPDWLALVGDTADGIPGIPRWGERSASAVLGRWGSLEAIPSSWRSWDVAVRGAESLSRELEARRQDALLYRTLATLRTDVPLHESLGDLEWRGPHRDALTTICAELGAPDLAARIPG